VTVGHPGARYQQVVVTVSVAKAGSRGFRSMRANTRHHVAYIAREGVALDGDRGHVYTAHGREAAVDTFLTRASGDAHQFRVVVSPEHGSSLDLTQMTRDLMDQMQDDLGTRLDWMAVNHYDTEHPHTHLIVRGRDADGQALYIRGDYIGEGLRYRAMECATMQLGYRREPACEIAPARTAEVGRERGGVEMEI
jgi:type IV secretory pathway VirD2 relaxase